MKIRYKLALAIFLISTTSSAVIIGLFAMINHDSHVEFVTEDIKAHLTSVTESLDDDLIELVLLTKSIAELVIVHDNLTSSNLEYSLLTQTERDTQIADLNAEWMANDSLIYPLIYERMNNEVSDYLNNQHDIAPELYGEIFLTNEYGVMISTTGKLTTLAHYEKYWWQAAYNDGAGITFLDDRGYDASVEGYVLGIVVPIMTEDDEILGMLKVNYNIETILTDKIIDSNNLGNDGVYSVVRSKGLIISKKDTIPLSVSVEEEILPILLQNEMIVKILNIDSKEQFLGVKPISISNGTDTIEFGGSYSSIDHIDGNQEEGWILVYSIDTSLAFHDAHTVLRTLIYSSVILSFIISLVSIYVGKYLTKSIVFLREFTEKVGKGDLSYRLQKTTNDEVGDLTISFNEMIENLQNTITTKDMLEEEISKKHILEKKLIEMSQVDELTNIYNRRAYNEFFNKYYEKAIRYGEELAVIIFDIDNFKIVNDKFGHLVGDKVLIEISKVVSKSLRKSDIFARWGGEEFIILLTNTPEDKVIEFAERIRLKVSQIKFAGAGSITISLGVCLINETLSRDELLVQADKAMYKAKKLGKNQTFIQK